VIEDPSLIVLGAALAIDVALGEPPSRLHPVVWMGTLTRALLRFAPATGPARQLIAGAVIAVVVPAAAVGLAIASQQAPSPLALVLAIFLLTSTVAARALGDAARAVQGPLERGDLEIARHGLRSLCSRDPSALGPTELAAGAVESVAENASDSVVAPLFYYAVFGLPGALAYRAINTLDAMIGYRGRDEYLGKAAARLDDAANLIPARLTAALLLLAGAVTGRDLRRGWRVLRRDGATTASPNAGRPMAAIAGLLAVELEKPGQYRLGAPAAAPTAATIAAAWRLVTIVFAAAALLCAAAILARAA
jgi:adenosylcobinamide-phosphate synthase